jgi:hypothetical protein
MRALLLFLVLLVGCQQPSEQRAGFFQSVPNVLNGVTVTNTPDAGQVLTATDTTTAAWQAAAAGAASDGGAPSGPAGGNLAGTYPNPTYGSVVPNSLLPPANATDAGTVVLANNLGGTKDAPTVVGLTMGSDAQGDIVYRGSSAYVRLGAGTNGQVLTTGGAAANPSWSTNFQANNLVTTGAGSFGATPAAAGNIRLPNAGNVSMRNAAASADLIALATDSSNGTIVGNSDGVVWLKSGSTVRMQLSGTTYFNLGTSTLALSVPAVTTDANAAFTITHTAKGSDVATNATTITSQAPFASATGSNRNPGNLSLKVPAAASGGTEGTLALNVKAVDVVKVSHDGTQGTVDFASIATNTSASDAGAGAALPLTPAGYVTFKVNGTSVRIPYYP